MTLCFSFVFLFFFLQVINKTIFTDLLLGICCVFFLFWFVVWLVWLLFFWNLMCKKRVSDTAYTKTPHKTQMWKIPFQQPNRYILQIYTLKLVIFSHEITPEKSHTYLSYKNNSQILPFLYWAFLTPIPHCAVDYFSSYAPIPIYTHTQPIAKFPKFT